jgi:MFS family permease
MKVPEVARNRQLLALCLVVLAAYAGQGMLTTVRVLYVHSQGGSLAVISAMTAAFLIANFVCQYPWGWLADRWGRKPVMLAGLLTQALLTAAYVFIGNPSLFIGLRVLEGAAAASILPAARAAISDLVPDEQRGQAYGVFTAFFNLGFLLGPALGGLLAAFSYRWVFSVAIALRVISVLIIWRGFRNPTRRAPAMSGGEAPTARTLFTLPLIAGYIIAFGDYLWVGFDLTLAPLWMRQHLDASLVLIGLAYSVWALPSAILAPFGGWLADRYRRSALILLCGLAQVPIYIVYAGATSIYIVMAFFAIQACLYAVVSPAVDAHVARSSTVPQRGRVQSIYTAVGVAGAFVGASVFVPLYALNYRLPLFALGGAYGLFVLIGGCMVLLSEHLNRVAGPEAQSKVGYDAPANRELEPTVSS